MDHSLLQDFHPADSGLEQPARELLLRYGSGFPSVPCRSEQFLALLAGVPSLRRVPGIPNPAEMGTDGFTALPQCATVRDASACQAHLRTACGITGRDSLLDFCARELRCHRQYLYFESIWEGRPLFDPACLTGSSSEFFSMARDFAAQFYDVVGRHGFLGWDISECVGLLRLGYACGLLSRSELDELGGYWIVQAQTFRSWAEYAASLLCGHLYWSFRQRAALSELREGQRLCLQLVSQLLENPNAWGSGMWYAPARKKNYAIQEADYRPLLRGWRGPNGCFATDHITVLAKKVGWCYREQPDSRFPDSGWRFFSGEESEDYIGDPANTDVYSLDAICNYDPDIIPLLTAPFGSAFARGADGSFRAEAFPGHVV